MSYVCSVRETVVSHHQFDNGCFLAARSAIATGVRKGDGGFDQTNVDDTLPTANQSTVPTVNVPSRPQVHRGSI